MHTSGNLVEPIVADALRDPDRTAIVLVGEDGSEAFLTAGMLHRDAVACAHGLQTRGVSPGDVVILVLGHSRQLLSTFLGALYLGAVPCIYPSATARLDLTVHGERLRMMVSQANARAVVTSPSLVAQVDASLEPASAIALDVNEIGTSDGAITIAPPTADSPAFVQFTSGTTRLPRGIVHTHGRVLAYLAAKNARDHYQPTDVVVSWLPLYHDLGLLSGIFTPLMHGMRTILMSPLHWARDPRILLQAIHRHRGTHCWMPNFGLAHCARSVRDRDLEGLDLSSFRHLVLGGEPIRVSSLQAFTERFAPYGFRPTAYFAGYGMAEVIEAGTATLRGSGPAVDWVVAHELAAVKRAVPTTPEAPGAVAIVSCGPPFDGTEVRIVDEAGGPLPERSVGEITLRSVYMMSGYCGRPELTAEVLRDGWLWSGDLGYMAGGELYVCGRKKDLIIVAGRNVFPQDIEHMADSVPGLRPGRSVAFGVDDEALGSERVVLICEATVPDDAARLTIERQLRRRSVEELEVVLSDVRIVAPGWIIKTSSGKVARSANRDKYRSELAGGSAT